MMHKKSAEILWKNICGVGSRSRPFRASRCQVSAVCYYILINTQNAQTVEKTTYLNKHAGGAGVAGRAWPQRGGEDCVWIVATLKTHQQLLQRERKRRR